MSVSASRAAPLSAPNSSPAFVDLTGAAPRWPAPAGLPDLRIDGYLGQRKAATVLMSADTARDRLVMTAEDTVIAADGRDATRVIFHAADAYGNIRPNVTGEVTLSSTGPADLIGDNPFSFTSYAAWPGCSSADGRLRPARSGSPPATRRSAAPSPS
jgi:Glycoside hydrolase family 2 C-terminal domain 5